jgi:predicted ABC-type ATPase
MPIIMIIAGTNCVGKPTFLEILRRNISSVVEPNVQIKATPSNTPFVIPHRGEL